MKELEEFYLKNLYPFQDGILNILRELKLPFYLTGGTPLSRFYFNHRYSDDLDLFVNQDNRFEDYAASFYKKLSNLQSEFNWSIDKQRISRSIDYLGFFISDRGLELKIDLINDVAPHYGEFNYDPVLGKIDSLRNILSNKISALYRYEPKDIADIWIICKNYKCDFNEILIEAKSKEAGVDALSIFEILSTFPAEKINLVKWKNKPDHKEFYSDLLVLPMIFFMDVKTLYLSIKHSPLLHSYIPPHLRNNLSRQNRIMGLKRINQLSTILPHFRKASIIII